MRRDLSGQPVAAADAGKAGKLQQTRFRVRRAVTHLLLVTGALAMLYPLLWLLSSSLKPGSDIFGAPSLGLWPRRFVVSNYGEGWQGVGQGFAFGHYFLNSLLLAVLTVAGALVSCSLAAYAFARIDFRLKKAWFALMLGSIMLPYEVVVIPQYFLFERMGWVNTYLPLLVPTALGQNAFIVFLITQFMRGLPREIDDAAAVDGAGVFRIYWHIILPLSAPAMVTAGLLVFLQSWGNFIAPLIYLNDAAKYTLPLGLASFVSEAGGGNYGPLLAMSALSLAIPFIVFVVFQRFILQGVVTSFR